MAMLSNYSRLRDSIRTDIATYEHRTHLRLDCHCRGIRGDPHTQPYSSQAPKPHESRCVRAWLIHLSTGLELGVQALCLTRREEVDAASARSISLRRKHT